MSRIRFLIPTSKGPVFYEQPTLRDALDLLQRWLTPNVCVGPEMSIWERRGNRWVPFTWKVQR